MPRRAAYKHEATQLPRVVLVDANIFFAPRMRDLFMHLHEAQAISVHWTKEIEKEWTRNVAGKQDADAQAIQACLYGMREAAQDWEVTGYKKYVEQFEPVDQKDRHVAAAAYKLSLDDWPGQPVALVTKNVVDFPQKAFVGTEVTRYSMAAYLDELYAHSPDLLVKVAEGCRKKLQAPRLTRTEYVAVLMKNGCPKLAQALAERWRVECPVMAKDGTLYYASEGKPAAGPKKKRRSSNFCRGSS